MPHIRDDIRHSLRILRRNPVTSVAIVLLLGLGVGANTAMFSVVDGVLLRPLPFDEPDRLVRLCETHATLGQACVASPPNTMAWADRVRGIAAIGLARDNAAQIRAGEASYSVTGGLATPGLFTTLRVRPALGRAFLDEDLADGRRDVVLLTDALWRERFGADPSVLERVIEHDGEPVRIVGVLPAGVDVPGLEHVRLWRILPFDPRDEANRDWRGFRVYARLSDGVSLEAAAGELAAVHARLGEEFPAANAGYGVRVRSLHDTVTGSIRPTLLVFSGALGLLLVVACANIANLLLAQATTRRGEFAVRAALGASRRDVARQLLVQAVILGLAGAVLALLFALWARSTLVALAPAGIPRLAETSIDVRVFAFAGLLAVLTTVGFAFAPVAQASRLDLAGLIREQGGAGGGRARHRTRRALVVAEVAVTTVLLVGAALLARSFVGLLSWEPGFETRGLTVFWAIAPADRYTDRPDATAALWRDLTDAIAATPGVTSVGSASAGPLFGGGDGEAAFRAAAAPDADGTPLRWYDVGPSYFETLGVRQAAGRGLDASDDAGAPRVALVNETAARRLAGSATNVVGRRLLHPFEDGEILEIVGVVDDVPPLTRGTPVPAEIYWPQAQRPRRATYFVVRSSAVDVVPLSRTLEARLAAVEPGLQLFRFRSYDDFIGAELVAPRFQTMLLAAFALLALALAAAGTYGVLAYSVTLRSREIGIRMALGAGRRRVVRAILAEGMLLVGSGAAIGLIAAIWLARGLRSLLFGVGTSDPLALIATLFALGCIGTLACLVPARRAAAVDPVRVMRDG